MENNFFIRKVETATNKTVETVARGLSESQAHEMYYQLEDTGTENGKFYFSFGCPL
jgi:hypothetical protein